MTSDDTRDPDRWLARAEQELLDALDDVLDLDAGLADATLPAHDDALVTALDDVLDLEEGLRGILPEPEPEPEPAASPQPAPALGPAPLTDYARDFVRLAAHSRLLARVWFPLAGLRALHQAAETAAECRALAHDFEHDPDVRVISGALQGSRDFVLDLAPARARALDRTLALIHALDHPRAGDLVRNHALVLVRVLDHIYTLDQARNRARELDACLARGEAAEARALAILIAAELVGATATFLERRVRTMRDAVIAESRDSAFSAAVAATGAEDLKTAIEVLQRALTDATHADLSDADLSGVPLVDVLWSSGTRWPAHLADGIRARSERIGPDLWRITSWATRVSESL